MLSRLCWSRVSAQLAFVVRGGSWGRAPLFPHTSEHSQAEKMGAEPSQEHCGPPGAQHSTAPPVHLQRGPDSPL